MPSTAPLTKANYATVVGYALYPIIFSAFEAVGYSTLPSNADVSSRYQTLVTPVGWSFVIWGLIFLLELIYSLLQLNPKFRAHPMVKAVGCWFLLASIGQFFWSLGFGMEQIIMSVLFMAVVLFALLGIVASQYAVKRDSTRMEYFLLQFPFEVHCGWITAAFAVNCNLAAVKEKASSNALFGLAIATIFYVIIAGVFCLYVLKHPNLTIPLVLAWATLGIAIELRSPIDSITRNYTETQIAVIRLLSAIVCTLLVLATIVRALWKFRPRKERSSGSTIEVAEEGSMLGITSDPQGGLR
mmetsp:Transcript_26517/g.58127  ORF Transcript_26517/g.58127 Transcript_26517/m.58127 type:complete len:299 (+) Transcript_26517:112-1008(+)